MDELLSTFAATRDVAESTVKAYSYRLTRWNRFKASTADGFRKAAIGKLSPATIEDTVKGMITLGLISDPGKRLPVPTPQPCPPTIEQIGMAYQFAHVANWPSQLNTHQRVRWWHNFIVLSLWTGARLSDLESLTWNDITPSGIRFVASKTGKPHYLPVSPSVRRHLGAARFFSPTVLGLPKCRRQLRREWKRICEAAEVTPWTVNKAFRQASITMWTIANPKAGEIIHGCGTIKNGTAVLNHYLGPQLLEDASRKIILPPAMLTIEEREQNERDAEELLQRFRQSSDQKRAFILQAARMTG